MIRSIALDADGVLMDMVTAAYRWHKKCLAGCINFYNSYPRGDYQMSKAFGMTPEQCWKPLDTVGFWRSVESYPGSFKFVDSLLRVLNSERIRVFIASQATMNPTTLGAKAETLSVFGLPVYVVWNGDKSPFDDGVTMLVDDCDANIDSWCGPSVLMPQVWNSRHAEVKDYFEPDYGSLLAEIRKLVKGKGAR